MKWTNYSWGVVGLAVLIGLAACDPLGAPGVTPVPGITPRPMSILPLHYERSGGFAGVQEGLDIGADGTVTVTQRGQRAVTGHLDAQQLAAVQTAGAAALAVSPAIQYGIAAPDAFVYNLTLGPTARKITVAESEGPVPTPPALLTFVALLTQVRAAVPAGLNAGPSPTQARVASILPLHYERSGGYVGVKEGLDIATDGTVTVTERGQANVTGHLDEGQLAAVQAAGAAACTVSPAARYGGMGADEFVYSLSLGQRGQQIVVDEIPGPVPTPPALLAFIALLRGIRAEVLAVGPGAGASPTAASAEPGAGADLLVYQVQGSRVKMNTEVFVDYRGVVHFYSLGTEKSTVQLTTQQQADLVTLFTANNFWALADSYVPTQPVNDGVRRSLTFTYGGQRKTVVVESGAAAVPAGWTTIITALDPLLASLQPPK